MLIKQVKVRKNILNLPLQLYINLKKYIINYPYSFLHIDKFNYGFLRFVYFFSLLKNTRRRLVAYGMLI